ncbi:hypothetical protein NC652_031784 [Populus alba x Populus x berolinensis]|nr:hypothetical protein NC652_031784 [Populus alba x Populus x berolinensis]
MELVIVGSCKELLCPVNIPNSATMDQNFHLEIGLWNPTVSMYLVLPFLTMSSFYIWFYMDDERTGDPLGKAVQVYFSCIIGTKTAIMYKGGLLFVDEWLHIMMKTTTNG